MKSLRIAAMLFVAPILFVAFTACGETETEWVTAPTISATQAAITAPDEGGTVTAGITVSNPTSDGSVSASASASWVTVGPCSASSVELSADPNPNSDPRTARVTVSYSYSLAGTRGTASCEITVAQSCGDQPAISVQPTAVAAATEGGSYSFSYTIVNPAPDGEVSASCSASWITDMDTSKDGEVGFEVAENSGGLRQAEITLSYSWPGGSISESVTVVQDHQPTADDDGDDGGSGSLVGTYTAGGYAYVSSGTDGYTTWTLKIYKYDGSATCSTPNYSGSFDYYIDGICPQAEGSYDYYGDHRVSAAAYVDASGNLVVPTQVLSTTSSGYYVGWTPAVSKSSSGWSYNYGWPDLTFTYNASNGCWEADYGVFMGAFTTTSLTVGENSGFYSFFDVVSPGDFQFTKDGDLGDGGGDVDLSEFVGTYSCSGTVYNEDYSPYVSGSSPFAEATWTMKIYDHGDGQLLLSGLVPDTVDYYPYDTGDGKTHDNGPYTAYATVSGNNIRVSYPQWTGWSTTLSDNSKVYMCWLCCPATTGDSGEGWYYNTSSGTCTFTYDSAAGSWTSNVGLFLGLCSSDSSLTSDTFYSYYDVFAPGMTFTKTSGSTSAGAAPSSLKSLTERPTHTGAKVSSALAPGTVSVTRSVGTLNMGDAKPSK